MHMHRHARTHTPLTPGDGGQEPGEVPAEEGFWALGVSAFGAGCFVLSKGWVLALRIWALSGWGRYWGSEARPLTVDCMLLRCLCCLKIRSVFS